VNLKPFVVNLWPFQGSRRSFAEVALATSIAVQGSWKGFGTLNAIGVWVFVTLQSFVNGQTESGGMVLAVTCWARAPRGGVTRQGVVLTDLESLLGCQ
jgi:hypothetical protein